MSPPQKHSNSTTDTFNVATSAPVEERKALFAAIRADDAAALQAILQKTPQAVFWHEPFAPSDNPFAKDNTPLMVAAQEGKAQAARTLLDNGAGQTMDAQNNRQWTALMFAGWHGQADIAEMILWHGADTHLTCENGHDAYNMASIRGHQNIMRVIDKHRNHTDGAAAFTEGTQKKLQTLKPLQFKKRI